MTDFAQYKIMDIADLKPAPWNYKHDDAKQAEALMENLRANGQVVNLNVRELPEGGYEIIDGNHRLVALLALKVKKAFVYDHGPLTEAEAQRVAVEINETRFPNDNEEFARIMENLKNEFGLEELLMTMPFTDIELDRLQQSIDWADDEEDFETVKFSFGNLKGKVLQEIYDVFLNAVAKAERLIGRDDLGSKLEALAAEFLNLPEESVE